MNSKYVMISGMAFSEETDMKKLKQYAKKGWILEDVVAGFFYKLKKDEPQDVDYSLDYQCEADEEYFSLFSEAGWTRVVSIGNQMHVFSAPEGTKPIYSDSESEMDKYARMKRQTGKGTIHSLIAMIVFIFACIGCAIAFKPAFLVAFLLFMASMVAFIFNFMPYLAYSSRLKQLSENGKLKSEAISNKYSRMTYAFAGVVFLILGVIDLTSKKYFGICFILIGICNIASSWNYYKKEKKTF